MNKNKFGLVVGSFFAFFHFVWVLFVAIGFAQPFLDFIMDIHLIHSPFLVAPFSLARSIVLLVFTFTVGYAFGFVIAFIWNKWNTFFKEKEKTVSTLGSNSAPISNPTSSINSNNQN